MRLEGDLQQGLAQLGRTGLREAGEQPCCGILGADVSGADMGSWVLGRVEGHAGGCGRGTRPGGSSRALTQKIL